MAGFDESYARLIEAFMRPIDRVLQQEFASRAKAVQVGDKLLIDFAPDSASKWVGGAILAALLIGPLELAVHRAWTIAPAIAVGLGVVLVLGLGIRAAGESLAVTSGSLAIIRGKPPVRRVQVIEAAAVIDVRSEVFSFAIWDPHIAIITEDGTYRVGWGLTETATHEICAQVRAKIGLPPN